MKIVFFDDDKKVLDSLEDLKEVQTYGLDEVSWYKGGMGGIARNYVILEDTQDFETITDAEILEQYKTQVKYTLARNYEDNRIRYLVEGTEEEKRAALEADKTEIDKKTNKEEIITKLHERGIPLKRGEAYRPEPANVPIETDE